jgi:hypothetical protein
MLARLQLAARPPAPLMALVVFAFTLLLAIIIFAAASTPAKAARAKSFQAISPGMHNNKIDDEIVAEIRRSKFLLADFTCEKEKVRGGVYFEAGFGMRLGIPVIWTVAKDQGFIY